MSEQFRRHFTLNDQGVLNLLDALQMHSPPVRTSPLLTNYPMIAADAYGLASPGPDFTARAMAMLHNNEIYRDTDADQPTDADAYVMGLSGWEYTDSVVRRYSRMIIHDDLIDLYSQIRPPANVDLLPELTQRKGSQKQRRRLAYESAIYSLVTGLYYQALYDDNFMTPIRLRGKIYNSQFILGHPWGVAYPGGPCQCEVMVVGKNPNRDEARQRRNFSGATAEVWSESLQESGIEDAQADGFYVTNILRFENPDPSSDKMPAAMVANCLPLLQMEIRLVQPRLIILLGNEAIHALLGKNSGLKDTIGRVMDYSYYAASTPMPLDLETPEQQTEWLSDKLRTCKVITSTHPAAVYHDPSRKTDLMKSTRLLSRVLNSDFKAEGLPENYDPDAPGREYEIITTEAHLLDWERRVLESGSNTFALDTEFHGLWPGEPERPLAPDPADRRGSYIRTVQVSWAHKKACSIEVTKIFGAPGDIRREVMVTVLTRLLKGPTKRLIFHYAAADLPWLCEPSGLGMEWMAEQFYAPDDDDPPADGDWSKWQQGWVKTRWIGGFDTILAGHAVEETQDLDLKSMALTHTNRGRYDRGIAQFLNSYVDRINTANKIDAKEKGYSYVAITKKDLGGYGMIPIGTIGNPYNLSDPDMQADLLGEYGCSDADVSWRLFMAFNGEYASNGEVIHPGQLDRDRFGECSREPFWISMRAAPAFLEMRRTGLGIDKVVAGRMRMAFEDGAARKLAELRRDIRWPAFNTNSTFDCRYLLFGEDLVGKFNNDGKASYQLPRNHYLDADDLPIALHPETYEPIPRDPITKNLPTLYHYDVPKEQLLTSSGTPSRKVPKPKRGGRLYPVFIELPESSQPITLGLIPYKSTGKKPKLWSDLVKDGKAALNNPSTDKETLTILGAQNKIAWMLRGVKYLSQVCKAVLRPPRVDEFGRPLTLMDVALEASRDDLSDDDFENMDYERGLLSYICRDGRVRTNFSQTKETGRASSWQPALQNLGKRREKDYKAELKDKYPGPLRSIIVAPPRLPEDGDTVGDGNDWVVVEADYKGAELAGMAGQAQDKNMMEHVRRMQLPDEGFNEHGIEVTGGGYPHPEHYCIHSSVAIEAFQLRIKFGANGEMLDTKGQPLFTETDLVFLRNQGMEPGHVHPSKWGLKKLARQDPRYSSIRDAAKPVVFGYAYGMGPASAQRKAKEEGADITLEQAEALIASLERKYPGLPAYFATARELSQRPNRQLLVNPFSRCRRFFPASDRLTIGNQEREAQNFPIQCVRLSSQVLTKGGYRAIGDLVGSEVTVPGVFGEGRGVCVASEVKDVWEIRTKRGLPLHVSADHVIFVYRDGGLRNIQTRDLKPGDWILESHHEVPGDLEMDPDEAYIIGCLLGDGSWGSRVGGEVVIRTTDAGIREAVTAAATRLFGALPFERIEHQGVHKPVWVLGLGSPGRDLISRVQLDDVKQSDRRLPSQLHRISLKARRALLRGLMDTDGQLRGTNIGHASSQVNFTSVSRMLVEDVFLLLSSVGLYPAFKGPYDNGRYSPFYRVLLSGRQLQKFVDDIQLNHSCKQILESTCKDVSTLPHDLVKHVASTVLESGVELTVNQRAHLNQMRKTGRGSSEAVSLYLDLSGTGEQHQLSNLRFDKVISSEPTGEKEQMADISVIDGHPSFTLRGNLVHNSLVADAVSRALDFFMKHPLKKVIGYRLCLQIHDAILFLVKVKHLKELAHVVIPQCMTDSVPIPVRALNGRYSDAPPYRLTTDIGVYRRWGSSIKLEEATMLGLPPEFIKA